MMTSISDPTGRAQGFPTTPTILSEQEQQAVWFLGALVRVRTHGSTTAGTLAVLEHNGGRGYSSPLHRHRYDEETFLVLDGELRVDVDGVTKSAGAGAAAILPRGLTHSFVVTSPEARFLTIHTPAALFFLVGRLVGVKMGSGRPPTPTNLWACEPVPQLGAGARPCRVTYCCFEHAGQNFGFLDRGPRAVHLM